MIFFNTDKTGIETAYDRMLEEEMEKDYIEKYESDDGEDDD